MLLCVCLTKLGCGNVIPGANTGLLTSEAHGGQFPEEEAHFDDVYAVRSRYCHTQLMVAGESQDEANS